MKIVGEKERKDQSDPNECAILKEIRRRERAHIDRCRESPERVDEHTIERGAEDGGDGSGEVVVGERRKKRITVVVEVNVCESQGRECKLTKLPS